MFYMTWSTWPDVPDMDMETAHFASRPCSPSWETPRKLYVDPDFPDQEIPIPRVKVLPGARTTLRNLCCEESTSMETLHEFFARWKRVEEGYTQPNVLAWLSHSEAIGWAAREGRIDIVKLLLGYGVRSNGRDVANALAFLGDTKDGEVLKMFVEGGWNVHTLVSDGTPITNWAWWNIYLTREPMLTRASCVTHILVAQPAVACI
ncbi:hypothetical protein K504DRAFT_462161 [Pleomassaria siparia CBS 279.74]|uniref:Ankyrin n=1 Tax=Pleomassaria siparia CBS 279.74 TaxID=1314801 RepID=A0A6G1KMN0_9PLEO|nr:hypothetical protein K504DRAFT_462161 [Pleomassaria siparia CBS 279.74]